jgi:hypothetical protein
MSDEQKVDFDSVLDEFMSSPSFGEPQHLDEWIRRYPEYTQELTRFALLQVQLDLMPQQEPDPAEDEVYLARGLEIMRGVISRQQKHPALVVITDLLAEASARGLNVRGLAHVLRLSVPLVNRLQRRLVAFSSIPGQLIQELARVLERDVAAVTAYLQQRPTFAQGVNYKSETAPVLAPPEDFFDALRADLGIVEDDRAYWLQYESRDRGSGQ